jgi:tetratricopeptide (TPR) repeat protein
MQAAADRYMYLPSLSILVLFGAGAALIIERGSRALLGALLAFISVATVGLSYATVTQAAVWKDTLTLWDYELRLYPDAFIPYMNRGVMYVKMGEHDKGMKDLDKAVSLAPTSRNVLYNRSLALKTMGRYNEALADIDKAISLRPGADLYVNRGNVRKRLGDPVGAAEDYRGALMLEPGNAATWFNLALVLEESGDIPGAIENAEKAGSLGLGQAGEYLEHLKASYPAQAQE